MKPWLAASADEFYIPELRSTNASYAEYNKPMYVEWDQSFDAHTRIIPLPSSFSLSCDIQIVVGFFSPTEEVVIKTFRKRSGTVFWNRVRVNRIFKYLNLGHMSLVKWNNNLSRANIFPNTFVRKDNSVKMITITRR